MSPFDSVQTLAGPSRLTGYCHRKAAAACHPAVKLRGEGGTVWMQLFLAMAHAKRDNKAEAEQWLDKALTHIAEDAKPDNPSPLSWDETIRRNILRREAEALVKGQDLAFKRQWSEFFPLCNDQMPSSVVLEVTSSKPQVPLPVARLGIDCAKPIRQ
jgi:hypothetical protein